MPPAVGELVPLLAGARLPLAEVVDRGDEVALLGSGLDRGVHLLALAR